MEIPNYESRLLLIERDLERMRKLLEGNGDSLEGRLRKEMDQIKSSYHDINKKLTSLETIINTLSDSYRNHIHQQEHRDEQERAFLRHLNIQTALLIVSILLTLIMNLLPK